MSHQSDGGNNKCNYGWVYGLINRYYVTYNLCRVGFRWIDIKIHIYHVYYVYLLITISDFECNKDAKKVK